MDVFWLATPHLPAYTHPRWYDGKPVEFIVCSPHAIEMLRIVAGAPQPDSPNEVNLFEYKGAAKTHVAYLGLFKIS